MRSPGNDTIAAIATGQGAGGIGIVRVSGPDALAVGTRVFRGRGGRPLESMPPLHLLLGTVVDPASGERLDEAFAVHMRAGSSYTGEPTVEFQCHGGRSVLDAVLRATLGAGARTAAPGEFTKRAFLSGRIDLSQAEAVADLIAARTEGARRAALSRLQGRLGERVRDARERLLSQIAAAEAILDHGDDEVDESGPDPATIESLALELRHLIALGESRERRHGGQRVVIAGRTNSGKSSIFNMLSESERSIVSPIPGTTRDYLEQDSPLDGTLVTLVDTAGLRDSDDPVEEEGIRRTREQMLAADLLILTIDGSIPLDSGDLQLVGELRERSPLLVITKSDLPQRIDRGQLLERFNGLPVLSLSTLDGLGCPELVRTVADRCRKNVDDGGEATEPNLRHREALRLAAGALEIAAELLSRPAVPLDQAVAELRGALAALGEITGESVGEELLDRIFSRFCLGK
jgi:tRNA modification GTPase